MGLRMELVSAVIGALAALAGVAIGHWFQHRAEKKRRISDTVLRALALARQYQYDVHEFGTAFVKIGDPPGPLAEGDDPNSVRQFVLEHSLRRFAEAERRLLDTEKELRLVGAGLALFTDLHRRPGDTVSFFDIIVDEMCGQLAQNMVSDATSANDVHDTVFRYGVIRTGFEQEAVEFLRKHVDRTINMPEAITIGAPSVESPETRAPGEQAPPSGDGVGPSTGPGHTTKAG
jgi:hypothetical protein